MTANRNPVGVRLRRRAARFLWHRTRRLLPDRHLPIPAACGRIYLNLHESPMMVQRAFRVYEYWTLRLFRRLVREGMTVLDIGGNKGDYALLAAKLMGDRGRVLCFEPDPANVQWLRKSIAANWYRSIEVFELALSDRAGTAVFYPGPASGWGSLVSDRAHAAPNRESFSVRTETLDAVLATQGVEMVDLVKIDVEGGELLVLGGATGLLSRPDAPHVVLDVDVQTAADRRAVYETLRSAGYEVYRIGPRLTPITALDESIPIVASKQAHLETLTLE